MNISENAKGGTFTTREPVMLVHELIEVLEKMPFDAIVNLRIKDSDPNEKEHYSRDADRKRVLTGRSQICVFQPSSDGSNVVIESWRPAL